MKNKLHDLRDHLFETLERLKDEKDPMDLNRARAITGVAGEIIKTGSLELRAYDLMGAPMTDFFPDERKEPQKRLPGAEQTRALPRRADGS